MASWSGRAAISCTMSPSVSGPMMTSASRKKSSSAADQSFFFDTYKAVWKGTGRFKLLDELQVNLNTRKPFVVKPNFKSIGARYADE